jgi:hypothetical protein
MKPGRDYVVEFRKRGLSILSCTPTRGQHLRLMVSDGSTTTSLVVAMSPSDWRAAANAAALARRLLRTSLETS